jgi:dihydropteroate synthase
MAGRLTTEPPPASMRIGPREFAWGARTYVMGIINVSPESFSGDGVATVDDALARARQLVAEGADILDVGGQSTRPGAVKTSAGFDELTPAEEVARVVPVIERLRAELPDMPVSVDTYKPAVAEAALAAGAHMLNDIYGFRGDPQLARVAAAAGVPVVLMQNQRGRACERDTIACALDGLRASVDAARAAGTPDGRLILDPGFGFGWTPAQNIELLRRLGELRALGRPLLVGTSRKSTIGAVLGGAPAGQRLFGTAATVALSIAGRADIVRVHDVASMRQVALVADAVVRGWPHEER